MRIVLAAFGLCGMLLPIHNRIGWKKPLSWCVGAYFLWLFLSALWSIDVNQTVFKLAVVAVFLVAAFGISRQLSFRQLALLCCLQSLTYLVIGLVAELSLGNFAPGRPEYRFTGTIHPNTCAAYAAFVCISSILFLDRHDRRRTLLWVTFAFSIGVVALLMTKSRTALASTVLALVAVQGLRTKGTTRMFLVAAGVGAVAIGTLTVSFLGGQAQNRLGAAAALGREDGLTTLTGRVPLWEELITQIQDRPIMGHGYLGFWSAERVEYLGDLFNWEIPHGHNMYLDVLLDGGVIGLTCFLMMLLCGIASAVRHYYQTNDQFVAFVFGVLIFAILHGMGESFFKMMTFPNFILTTLLLRLTWHDSNERMIVDES